MNLFIYLLSVCGVFGAVSLQGNITMKGVLSVQPSTPDVLISNYMIWIGQSNARGIDPAVSMTQTNNNQMWSNGVLGTGGGATNQTLGTFVPLVEASFESPCSGFANHLRLKTGLNWATIQANYARGGAGYDIIKKGGTGSNYALSVDSVIAAKVILTNFFVPCILSVHGETDGEDGYDTKEIEWQSDYQTDIQAVTGQSSMIPIFHSQVQARDATGTNGMLSAHEHYPTKNILVGPKYQFIYQPEGTHLTNYHYTWLGEYYAEAFYKRVILGQTYNPLRPVLIATAGNVISITYTGMIGPLVFDTNRVFFQTNYGFEYLDFGGGAPSISSVAISGSDTNVVQITLTGAPTGSSARIAYAYTGGPFGYATGCRGNLRDSNPAIGNVTGSNLYNWCAHFYKPLSFSAP